MDQPDLNMRQHRWLDVVKDCNCEILYHPRKANVVPDALSCNAVVASIWDICLKITMITPLLERIREAYVKGRKEECQKCERIIGQVASFDYSSSGL